MRPTNRCASWSRAPFATRPQSSRGRASRPQRMGSGDAVGETVWCEEECPVFRRGECEADVSIKLFALTCGHLTGDLGYLMEGGEGKAELPIPAYLIEHPKGTALFDTGMHPDCQRDPAGRVGQRAAGLFSFHFPPAEEISALLEAIDRDPARVDIIVNSHFHFDHVGGNALVPNAVMVVQQREWEAGM